MKQIYRKTPIPKFDFNKVALQFFWNHTSAWMFCCKFDAHIFEHLFLRTPLDGCFCPVFQQPALFLSEQKNQNQRPEVFCKKRVFENFANFTENICVAKRFQHKSFFCEICEIFKNSYGIVQIVQLYAFNPAFQSFKILQKFRQKKV